MDADSIFSFSDLSAGDLMVLETPLLRVSRPVAACSPCRAAKVKCDGKLPVCTACEKANRADRCSSTNDQFARGKERSYVATLESRVEKLEKKIQEARARRQSSIVMQDSDSTATPRNLSIGAGTAAAARQPPQSKRAARRKEALNIDNLVSDFGLLTVNATARDFYGFTSAMSYARLILSASNKEPLPAGITKPLPPRYLATNLLQHYMNHAFVLLPIFDEARFWASVDAVYGAESRRASAHDHWNVRMVLSLASISLSRQRGDNNYSDAISHINCALQHAEEVLHPGSVQSIQALLLLVEFALMDPQHFDSWILIGAASRAMVDLGLHQDPGKSTKIARAKLDLRRKVYYCVYALDRSTSIVQTRAFSFSDDSANVALPFSLAAQSPVKSPSRNQAGPQSFDSAVDLFKLRQIQSRWYTDLYQSGRDPWPDPYSYIWQAYHEMTEWHKSITSTAARSTKTFFELELLYSYVYVLSASPRCPQVSSYAQFIIFEHCIAYASKLLTSMNDEVPAHRPPVTFYDAMRAYITARNFVVILSQNQEGLLSPSRPSFHRQDSLASSSDAEVDPLSPAPPVAAPPIPSPYVAYPSSNNGVQLPLDHITRAIGAIQDFTTILSQFELRFGYINWRERFQRDSARLLAQLYNRSSMPHQSQPHTTHPQTSLSFPATVNHGISDPQPLHLSSQDSNFLSNYPTGMPLTAALPPHQSQSPLQHSPGARPASSHSYNSQPQIHPQVSAPPLDWISLNGSTPAVAQDFNGLQYSMPPNPSLSTSPHAVTVTDPMLAPNMHQLTPPIPQSADGSSAGAGGPVLYGDTGMWATALETLPGGSLNARFSFE